MWEPGIGLGKLLLLGFMVSVLLLLGKRGRRWMVGIVPCLVIGMLVTPPDLLSTVVVSVPLLIAFASGVYLAKFILGPRSA